VAKGKNTAPDLPPGVPPDGPPIPGASEGDAPPPPHGSQRKLTKADVAGELPRVCSGLDRVPGGSEAKRFKCRVANYSGHAKPLYVLALDAESAKACHTKAVGLDAYIQTLRDQGLKDADIDRPRVVVNELPD
jgi:hypothetical protein